ncbi:MAG: hypothetical protein JSS86_02155 [Cyanobacteria bacterium SZAS LIN-2]|nr:hypothetical protein [Cyanobacteria bacterium SZAS LIN-3]MBS1995078.1 hypothetical protein [Cyanobacteria bacterium SZAS LIN-2]
MKQSPRRSRRRKLRDRGASVAEFGPVLVIFVLIIIIPLLNLLAFATGYACVSSTCQSCAADAANSTTFEEALVNVKKRARALVESSLGQFARVKPVGGYQDCGVDVYIATTKLSDPNSGHFYGPNTGLPANVTADAATYIYEYTVRSSFAVGPLMDLSAVPLVGALPLIGKPVTLSNQANRAAEHTDALNGNSGSAQ